VIEGVKVFHQGVLGINRQAVDGAPCWRTADTAFFGTSQRWHVEQLGDTLPPFHLTDQYSPAAGGKSAAESSGDSGFAGAAFTADDVQGVAGTHDTPAMVMPACVL
jgi:hypothetical protein